jgi:hypothetical protein
MTTTTILTASELEAITGYRRAAEQLRVLRERGYWRAYRDRLGRVVLERPHYDAVCRGQDRQPAQAERPQLQPVAWGRSTASP